MLSFRGFMTHQSVLTVTTFHAASQGCKCLQGLNNLAYWLMNK
jgi:hypothetical protein